MENRKNNREKERKGRIRERERERESDTKFCRAIELYALRDFFMQISPS